MSIADLAAVRFGLAVTAALALLGRSVPLEPAAMSQAQPPRAGARYKSVRVLNDIPASAMIPTMAFVANSLGVTCAHCHTDVYESDEKPMKDKARQMIRMTRAINASYDGRNVVTCQTCHDGRPVPNATPLIENAGWNARPVQADPSPLPAVNAVMDRYERAAGVGALKGLRTQTATGTITRNNGRTAPVSERFELYQEVPRTLRLSTPLSHPPEGDADLPMTFLGPPLLRDSYADLRVTGRDRIPEPVVVVEGTSRRGGMHRLFFSERTGLLVRRSEELDTPLGSLPQRYDFSEYRAVNGVRIPMRIVWSRADYQVTFAFSSVRHGKDR
jgi:hypothetical protein